MKVHHIGYAVKDICNAKKKFERLGFREEQSTVIDSLRNIEILFMVNEQERVELIAALEKVGGGGKTPVDTVLKKNGPCPYHICYITEKIDEEINYMRKEGYLIIEQPKPAPALSNRRVAFLYHKDIGLIELMEE